MTMAVNRRARQELGIRVHDLMAVLPDYRYKTPVFKGIRENEVCPVFLARISRVSVKPNPKEVSEYRWMEWLDFAHEALDDTGNNFSWWCKDQLKQLNGSALLSGYIRETIDK